MRGPDRALLLCGFALLTHSVPAHAYLDPGTASILLQAFIGAVAAWLVAGKLYAGRVTAWFKNLRKADREKKTNDDPTSS